MAPAYPPPVPGEVMSHPTWSQVAAAFREGGSTMSTGAAVGVGLYAVAMSIREVAAAIRAHTQARAADGRLSSSGDVR